MVNSCVRKAMPELTWDVMYEKHCAMNIYAALASVFKERPGKCHFLDSLEFHIDLLNCYASSTFV